MHSPHIHLVSDAREHGLGVADVGDQADAADQPRCSCRGAISPAVLRGDCQQLAVNVLKALQRVGVVQTEQPATLTTASVA